MKLTLTDNNRIRFYVAKSVADAHGTGPENINALWQSFNHAATLYYKNYHNELLVRVLEMEDYLYLIITYPGNIVVQQYDKSGRKDLMNIATHYKRMTKSWMPKFYPGEKMPGIDTDNKEHIDA